MSSLYKLIIIFSTTLLYCLQLCKPQQPSSNETDVMALLEIRAKVTNDPLGVMSSWNDTLHFCKWHGVTCDYEQQRVVSLDLHSSKLTGIISPYLGNLSFLKELYLHNNSFGGNIPSEIGRLGKLETLQLSNNSIAGQIPSNISGCTNLIDFQVYGNMLVGEIPSEIGFLSHLQSIGLSTNEFTGSIPSSLGNLSSLSKLYAAENYLTGRIPRNLGNLNNFTKLALGKNRLSGVVPTSIFNLTSLTVLDLGYNDLEGNLPSDIGNTLPNLQWLSLTTNLFTGNIPSSISNSSKLELLQLSQNKFQGQVPYLNKLERITHLHLDDNSLGHGLATDLDFVISLANATMLQTFYINTNNFTGVLPRTICNFTAIRTLLFHINSISGDIPDCIENLSELEALGLNDNALSGIIPQGIGKLQNLGLLYLSDNPLSGKIPPSIGNLTNLYLLTLSNNNLEGIIPSSLGNCISLEGLELSQNKLSGKIPQELFRLSGLSLGLSLSSNQLTGPLPDEVGQLRNIEGLDLSYNQLSGDIPNSLGNCKSLELLNLGGNRFQGDISKPLMTLQGLQVLDLSQNNFSGKIPMFLTSFQLQALNLSYNNFEGEVPTSGVFSNVTAFSIASNNRLCGGITELKLPHCKVSYKPREKRSKHNRKFTVAILSGLFGVILVAALVVLLYILHFRKRTMKPIVASDSTNFPNLSYQTLLKATNGFSLENLIGTGAFGVVYKGILDEDGPNVAIKVFNLENSGASKSFMVECEVLRRIRHRHLVKVITACSSIDYQGRDFKALVYEYMENGSLEDWLHPQQAVQRNLNLCQRLDIAVHVAFALDYLHHNFGDPIVHCDLKPSNVLLDNEMVAHISDFGLAKFHNKDSQDYQSSSIGVKGTIGYTPPEYGLGNDTSTHGDIYSYGILLLEIFTGKRPTSDIFRGTLSLHDFVKQALPEQVYGILDYDIVEEINNEEETQRREILESLTSILGLALSCSTEVPQERSSISDVVTKLLHIRNKLLPPRVHRQRRA